VKPEDQPHAKQERRAVAEWEPVPGARSPPSLADEIKEGIEYFAA
jgi:hypothetical protein